MLHEDYGHYSYTEHYSLGDIFIYTSADEEKGVLLKEYGCNLNNYNPYQHSDNPQFRDEKTNWF